MCIKKDNSMSCGEKFISGLLENNSSNYEVQFMTVSIRNKNALSSIESRLLGDEFRCQRARCCYTTFSFGIHNECCMS